MAEELNNEASKIDNDCCGNEFDPRENVCQSCLSKLECACSFYLNSTDYISDDLSYLDEETLQELSDNLLLNQTEEKLIMATQAKNVVAGVPVPQASVPVPQVASTPEVVPEAAPVNTDVEQEQILEEAAKDSSKTEKVKAPRERNKYGFTKGSKGDMITQLLEKGTLTKSEILKDVNAEFGTDSSGRLNIVMYSLRKKGHELNVIMTGEEGNQKRVYKLEYKGSDASSA